MEYIKIKDLDVHISDGNYSSKYPNSSEFISSGVPFIRCNNFFNNSITDKDMYYISEEKHAELLKGHLRTNDVLISTRGNIGQVVIVPDEYNDANINAQIVLLRSGLTIDSKYLMWTLKSSYVQKQMEQNQTGSALKQLPVKRLCEIKVPIEKDIEVQKSIADRLDNVFSMMNLKKEQIRKCDKLIKSQFVEMFNDKTFEAIELNELCDVRDGTHDSPKYLDSSDYKFITSKNIIGNSIDFSDCKYIKEDDYNKFNQRSKVNTGDILMPMIGTIGNPIIVNIPEDEIDFAIKNVALIKFNSNSKVINVYIKSLLNSDFFENAISQNKRGGTQKFIALSDIRKIKVPVPPIELQNKFAQIVEQIDKQKFQFEKSLKKLEELQASLMQEYFG